jgi:polyene macrolide polyketide synthase
LTDNPAKLREYLERVTLDLRKARRQVEELEGREGEPIAIVGMACRYPGGVGSPAELWEMVAAGRDGITEFPADRGWDLERLYDPDREAGAERTTSYTREGGFVRDSAEFDAGFFGISPREALIMDPQQRLLLEASWQALEDAGIDPGDLAQSQTGVFAGVMYQDYGRAPGMSQSLVSGRLAYSLDVGGPAISVDTACSSSLVAMHLASQALRAGECSLALAGGVTVLSTPEAFVEFSRRRGLAPDGRSKSFAEAADGVGWSEGVGVLTLERLADARRNGHTVLAILKGSAVNQDGASNGITAPNGPSQERVIRQALANAGLTPQDVDAVEAHGTGTTLGDPIEAGALLATYGQERDEPLRLGSIKSNLGHTQAAAGVAGVIKLVEALRHEVLPRTLHVDAPSSRVDWDSGEVELLTEELAWRADGRPRRAGVSSFGISGTNAHVIVEEAPAPEPEVADGEAETPEAPLPGSIALPLSAKSKAALREAAANLAAHLSDNPDLDPADVGFSLARTRALFEQRAVVLGSDRAELIEFLRAFAEGETVPNAIEAKARSGKLAYLFTGQGAQRAGMGKELYEASPPFAKALDEVCEALDVHLERPLKELLFAAEGSAEAMLLDDTTYTQPALFAIEVALLRLFEQLGMKPDYLTGHSIGELAAAHASGVLSLPDAAKLVAARGRLMGALPSGGAMVAIEASEEEVAKAIEGKEGELSIAAINSPTSVVVSGQEKPALEVQSHFEEQGRRTKRLTVSHAFHSPLMEPMLAEFAEVAKSLDYQGPQIPIVSNLTGEVLSAEQATDPAYWVTHVRRAVRFADAVATLDAQGTTAYLELGPDAVLTAMAATALPEDSSAELIPSLRSGREEPEALTAALAAAYVAGAKVEWAELYPGAKRVPLPTYPFQRERFWTQLRRYWDPPGVGFVDAASIGQREVDHPLLAAAVEEPDGEGLLLTGRISLATHPWLADHAVLGTAIVPGTAFVDLALRAAEEVGCEEIEELTVQAPLVLPEAGAISLRVSVAAPDELGNRPLRIHSRGEVEDEAGEWTLHAAGALAAGSLDAPAPPGAWPPQGAEPIETDDLYLHLAETGFDYGPAFQGVDAAWRKDDEIYAEVSLPEELREEAGRFSIHPALLDSSFHVGIDAGVGGAEEGGPSLPFLWSGVRVRGAGAASLRVRASTSTEQLSLLATDQSGMPAVEIDSIVSRPIERSQLISAGPSALHRQRWQGLPLPEVAEGEAELPEAILLDAREWERSDPVETPHAFAARALERIQAHLAGEETAGKRLVFLAEGAFDAGEEDPDLAMATLAGLLRSAHSEHPGRFALIDSDGSEASTEALDPALAATAGEPQIALREGKALVPRLEETQAEEHRRDTSTFDPEKTVLLTGATGGLGALFARHLAEAHGVRHLLLLSRSGEEAPGAKELREELESLGAEATISACDVADRKQLESAIDSVEAAHPLGAAIHAAGVFDNGLVSDLDPERLRTAMAPKVDAAWHLHELTRDLDLSAFVLFSSSAGLLGGPGQGNYAAANGFLDALASHRKSQGLPATSLAWGLWEQESNLAGGADAEQIEQVRRQTRMLLGFAPIPVERGLALFDQTLADGDSLLAPVLFDRAALRAQAKGGSLPAPMRGLVRVPKSRERDGEVLAARLVSVPEEEREAFVLDFVRGHAAAVLGYDLASSVDPDMAFKDLGFDSLAAVELRNRLVAGTAMQLPATMAFDYPSAAALAEQICAGVGLRGDGDRLDPGVAVDKEFDRLEEVLAGIEPGEAFDRASARLRRLLASIDAEDRDELAEDATDEEMFDLLDKKLGRV